jgi:hypothetical protein
MLLCLLEINNRMLRNPKRLLTDWCEPVLLQTLHLWTYDCEQNPRPLLRLTLCLRVDVCQVLRP